MIDLSSLVADLLSAQKWLYDGMTTGLKTASGTAGFSAMMGTAFLFGCLHALMPGHGKTLLFAYHFGRQSRILQGTATAILLAVMHVGAGALLVLIGAKVMSVSFASAGRVQSLELLSGVLVTMTGIYMAVRAVTPHNHHEMTNGGLLSFSAGLIPCPLTMFVLTYSISQGRVPAGFAAVLSMLGGIAVTLVTFAIAAIVLRDHLSLRLEQTSFQRARLAIGIEFVSATLIVLLGVLSTIRAL